jgi:hypothetical protein
MKSPKLIFSDHEGEIFEIQGDSGYTHTTAFDRDGGWWCTCEDYFFRKRFCKHVDACSNLSKTTSREVYTGM